MELSRQNSSIAQILLARRRPSASKEHGPSLPPSSVGGRRHQDAAWLGRSPFVVRTKLLIRNCLGDR